MRKSSTKNAKKTARKTAEIEQIADPVTAPVAKQPREYQGKQFPATRVFIRTLTAFKNCDAEMVMAINDSAGTVQYLNLYNSILPPSYQSGPYTFPIVDKVIAKKVADMREMSPDEWPKYLTNVSGAPAAKKATRLKTAK